jgi:pimeloyl-ACP methyl ester carboxylesterase
MLEAWAPLVEGAEDAEDVGGCGCGVGDAGGGRGRGRNRDRGGRRTPRQQVCAHFIGHSFGTVVCAWVVRQAPEMVAAVTLIDPIPFLLNKADVCYNFMYREAQSAWDVVVRYMVATELYTSYFLSRCFVWHENILWPDDLDGIPTTVVLSGCDQIVPSYAIRRFLEAAQADRDSDTAAAAAAAAGGDGEAEGETAANAGGCGEGAPSAKVAQRLKGSEGVGRRAPSMSLLGVLSPTRSSPRLNVLWYPTMAHAGFLEPWQCVAGGALGDIVEAVAAVGRGN